MIDVLDAYEAMDDKQKQYVNLNASIDANYLIDIHGRAYTWEIKTALEGKISKAYKIGNAAAQKYDPKPKKIKGEF